jgi:diguanylate cyclase (GGDEF)-like protein/PAS domain S-box-containing protein
LPASYSGDRQRRQPELTDHRGEPQIALERGDISYRRIVEQMPAVAYRRPLREGEGPGYVSPQVEQLLGWTPAEFLARPDPWLTHVHPVDYERVCAAFERATAIRQPFDVEYRVITRDGRLVWLRDMASLDTLPEADDLVWHGVLVDMTASKSAESELHLLAFYDSLTGLPNRRLCVDRLHAVLQRADRPQVALLFIDLDRFKFINDGIGHAAGDELLAAVAQRLAARVDGYGTLARYGGDEFVAILENVGRRDVEALAASILATLRRPFTVDGYELTVEGTIGIAFAAADLATPDALLHAADVALYRAKGNGGDAFAVYDVAIDRESPDRVEYEAEMRRALKRGEFQIAYQPVVDLATGAISSVEALVRWRHPERGLLRPAAFVPFANQTGLIVPLGKWVIVEACRQLRQWQERFPALHALKVSVNLSGRQFRQATLTSDVAQALRDSGLPPQNLTLEIKEGDALADANAIAAKLHEFKRLGISVTIDDFGEGLAALGSLTRFAVDDLKIDGSRVARLAGDKQEAGVVRALVSMAKAMGMEVTAGAVETGEQLALLRELGCDRAQGRHLSPPLLAPDLERLLARGAALDQDRLTRSA